MLVDGTADPDSEWGAWRGVWRDGPPGRVGAKDQRGDVRPRVVDPEGEVKKRGKRVVGTGKEKVMRRLCIGKVWAESAARKEREADGERSVGENEPLGKKSRQERPGEKGLRGQKAKGKSPGEKSLNGQGSKEKKRSR